MIDRGALYFRFKGEKFGSGCMGEQLENVLIKRSESSVTIPFQKKNSGPNSPREVAFWGLFSDLVGVHFFTHKFHFEEMWNQN